MPRPTHVFVIVPKPTKEDPAERSVPVPMSDARSSSGLLIAVPGKVYALPWNTSTRKRINGGDFQLAKQDGTRAKHEVDAAAPADVKLSPEGWVDEDQRSDDEVNAAASAKAKVAAAHAAPTAPRKDS